MVASHRAADPQNDTPSFSASLEERARQIIDAAPEPISEFSATSFFEEQLALTLDQIDKLRSRERELRHALLRAECEVETELLQMEDRTPRYSPYRYPEREKLQRRLAQLAEEGRRLLLSQGEKMDGLHDRLLALLQKHRQLR